MTQLRRTIPAPLVALFASGTKVHSVRVISITLNGGTVLNYTEGEVPATVDATTYQLGPGFDFGDIKIQAGVELSKLDLRLHARDTDTINGTPWIPFVLRGGLDGARISVWRAYAPAPASTLGGAYVGKLPVFVNGRAADANRDAPGIVSITVLPFTEVLDAPLPSDVYEPSCINQLYGTACGVNRAAFTVSGSVTTASDSLRLTIGHALAQAAGHFTLGAITFTSGPNAGVSRTVRLHTSGVITFMQPLPAVAAVGNTFTIVPGCDLTKATCQGKFSNGARYRGFRFTPAPETAL